MRIISIEDSPIKTKRFRVLLDNGNTYDFGLRGGSTYIDHHDINKRNAYIARHFANRLEKKLIINLVPSPALFSMYLLWGKYPDLGKNIDLLNNIFKKNYI
jgi:hypothetical protein